MTGTQDSATTRETIRRTGDDSALRDDIRLLGRLLGDVLRTHEGTALYDTVEEIRQTSTRFRRHDDPADARQLDRLSRSVKDFAEMLDLSRYYGWKLVILDCNVDTSTPAGEMLAGVMAQFAQFERRMIGVRTREALAVKKTQGIVGGRRANVSEDVITDLRAMRSQGMSYAAISDQLNANDVPTAQGGKQWYAATVQRVLDRVAA